MDLRKKLINCNTVSDGYFDTRWAFVDAFLKKILDLEGARPKTKGHTVVILCIFILGVNQCGVYLFWALITTLQENINLRPLWFF